MGLLFGTRPFEFVDFFSLFQDGKLDFTKLNYIEVVNKHMSAGFKHFEINGDLVHVLPGIITPEVIKVLAEIKEQNDISFSVHLPLWAIEPAAFASQIRKASADIFIDCINLTKPLDPVCWVIHPTGALTVEFINLNLPDFAKRVMLSQFSSYAAEVIKTIITETEISSRKIAVENIEFPFEIMYPIIEQLDLSICFDTGHQLAGFSGKDSIMEFVNKYYNRIIELHLHDGAYPRIDHKPLGTQNLPTRDLLLKLKENEFSGPLVYELNFDEILQSMDFVRKNIPEVLKENSG
ncbi:MAG: sugar phosphate isomerase/epimerase [Asgard group archaeon]|nr:sugar phosphate isomerase/epimerase [Asgard group archaeon]